MAVIASWGLTDTVLVSSALLVMVVYHGFLIDKVKRAPLQTTMGVNQQSRRLWVHEMLIENDKHNVLAVQTLRNSIMECTLMATVAVLLMAGLATYFGFASNMKQPLGSGDGNRGLSGSSKCMAILICFMVSFFCHTQSIRFLNHVNYMVNIPLDAARHAITADYVADLLERGTILYAIGSHCFYVAFPLLLWLFGSLPMLLCALALVNCLYHVDFVRVQLEQDATTGDSRKKLSTDGQHVELHVACYQGSSGRALPI